MKILITEKQLRFLNTQIAEAFDSPYPITFYKSYGDTKVMNFTTDSGKTYQIKFSYTRGFHRWVVEFVLTNNESEAWGNESEAWGITGTGNQMKVFATVMMVIRDFLEKEKPRELVFSADKDIDMTSRSRLYTTLVNRYLPEEYMLNMEERMYKTIYHLTKKNDMAIF